MADKRKGNHYPPDIEPVPADSEFFDDLCGLIEEHSDSFEEMERYLCSLGDFQEDWMNTLSATGCLWMMDEETLDN